MRALALALAALAFALPANATGFDLILGLDSPGGDIHDYILDSGLSGADCGAAVQALNAVLPDAAFDCLPGGN